MVRYGLLFLICAFIVAGCRNGSSPSASSSPADTAQGGGGGGDVVTPDVGPATPVSHTSLDDASGGGINSSAVKKAKGIAGNGVSSVDSAQKQGYGADDGN